MSGNWLSVVFCCAESVSTLFDTDVQFDFVINCAGETKLGQSDAVGCTDIYINIMIYQCDAIGCTDIYHIIQYDILV